MSQKQLHVLIVDDHQVVREGLRTMLNLENKKFQFRVSEAITGEEACALVKNRDIDLVLMDYNLPGIKGPKAVYELLIYKPKTMVLGISNSDELAMVNQMIEAGAKGYLLKNVSYAELLCAVEALLEGKNYQSFELLLRQEKDVTNNKFMVAGVQLTPREHEIFLLVAQEYTNKEIAQHLHIDKRTVDNHRHNLLRKLKVKNSIGLVRLAYKYHLCE